MNNNPIFDDERALKQDNFINMERDKHTTCFKFAPYLSREAA